MSFPTNFESDFLQGAGWKVVRKFFLGNIIFHDFSRNFNCVNWAFSFSNFFRSEPFDCVYVLKTGTYERLNLSHVYKVSSYNVKR